MLCIFLQKQSHYFSNDPRICIYIHVYIVTLSAWLYKFINTLYEYKSNLLCLQSLLLLRKTTNT